MIDIIKYTPIEYSKQSRDYQIISRLYSALFNVSKMYIDNMEIWNENIDNKLATLRAITLNFDIEHIWDLNDLEAITICFKYLMKRKGTIEALNAILSILMKVENINVDYNNTNDITLEDDNCVYIRVEKGLVSLGIIEDLVKYILPAGLTYRIIEYSAFEADGLLKDIEVEFENEVSSSKEKHSYKMYIGDGGDGVTNKKETWPDKPRKFIETYIYGNEDMLDSEGNPIKEEGEESNKGGN